MIVRLPNARRDELERFARAAAPREACGILVGVEDAGGAEVCSVAPARNLAARDDAFELDSLELARIDRQARDDGLAVIGIWHSHPRSAAVPSARDRAGALPGWRHVIVGIATDRPDIRCWRLADGALVEDDVQP